MKLKKMSIMLTHSKLVAALALSSMLCLSLAAQNPQDVKTPPKPDEGRVNLPTRLARTRSFSRSIRVKITARSAGVPDGPVRIKITARAKGSPSMTPEFDFKGANGMVTGLSATSERKTFTFEREAAGLSCPTGKVKECDALNLKDGGSVTTCVCLAPEKGNSSPASGGTDPSSADMRYDVALSDGTTLRSTGGGAQKT